MARKRKSKNNKEKCSTAGSKKDIDVKNEMLTVKKEPDDEVGYILNSIDSYPLGDVNDDQPTVSIENEIKHEIEFSPPESPKDMDSEPKPKTRSYKKSSLYRALIPYKKYYIPKKLMKEKTLNLEAILRLTEKPLIALFSQMSSNEITRNYAYTCCLIPSECALSFQSFGNEGKARNQMYEHLLNHLTELLNKKKADPTFVFSADVVKKNLLLGECMDDNYFLIIFLIHIFLQ
ncbi:hypothetical protein HELRODRAFT_174740 [Helobdella robusta]|uniref:Uncharacterized protein n=1 Tax=Helobdella robusta TaxID=6412 RepID=T1F8F3_HELRO|nr:hypothetical protein HELRODRAFT_174740 [Helobdella robusta]ESO01758.1 hypothetical protein HELRODRAFT_174740 [Helobdella robusta]